MVYRNAYDANAYETQGFRDAPSGIRPVEKREESSSAISRLPLAQYEWMIVDQRGYFDLNVSTVDKYHMLFRLASTDHEWLSLDRHDFLVRIGALEMLGDGQYAVTAAGLLMFGRERDIVRVFPSYFLDCRFEEEQKENAVMPSRWRKRFTSQDGDWSGNLLDFYHRAYSSLVGDFPAIVNELGCKDREEALRAARTAVKEALVNALVNADYAGYGGVTVTRKALSIDISNPGHLGVDLDLALTGGITNPFNKVIARMFALAGLCDRAGYGLPCIFDGWRKLGLPMPTIEELSRFERVHMVLSLDPSPAGRDVEDELLAEDVAAKRTPDEERETFSPVEIDPAELGIFRPGMTLADFFGEEDDDGEDDLACEDDVLAGDEGQDDEADGKTGAEEDSRKRKKDKGAKKRLRGKDESGKAKDKKSKKKKISILGNREKSDSRKKKGGKKRGKKKLAGPMPDDIVADVRERLRQQLEEQAPGPKPAKPGREAISEPARGEESAPGSETGRTTFPVVPELDPRPTDRRQEDGRQTSTGHGSFIYHGQRLTWGDSGDPLD